MLNLFHSLRTKLLVGFILIVGLAMGTVAFVATKTTQKEFGRYLTQDQAMRYQRWSRVLSSYYRQTGSWKGVENLLNDIQKNYTGRVVLVSGKGEILGGTTEISTRSLGTAGTLKVANLSYEDQTVGTIYVRKQSHSSIEKAFLSSVKNSIYMASIIAGLAGVFLSIVFFRQVIKPVKALTSASREMKEGNLNQKVRVGSNDEIGELTEIFNDMAEELHEQKRLQDNMMTDVAHELRSPVSNLQLQLEGIKEDIMEPTSDRIESLYQETMSLNHLVDDLRDLSRAEAGQLQLDCRLIALQDITTKVIHSLQPRISEKSINLQVIMDNSLTIKGDPERLRQVLRNLLENAVVHTPEEGQITLSAHKKEQDIEIQVSDSGEGIPEEDLPFVFDRFYRVDKSRDRGKGGSGLGLTIVKQIIEAHGGDIQVESTPGEGTTFTFQLPSGDNSTTT